MLKVIGICSLATGIEILQSWVFYFHQETATQAVPFFIFFHFFMVKELCKLKPGGEKKNFSFFR